MEAGNTKRAALRLAAMSGGVVLTLVLVVATVALLASSGEEARVAEKTPEADVIEIGESYELPIADITPVVATPAAGLVPKEQPMPAYVEPYTSTAVAADQPVAVETPTMRHNPWDGSVTIHNPAAFGPPEDGSLPPIPTPGLAPTPRPQAASRPSMGPRFAPVEPNEPSPPTSWEASEPSLAESPAMKPMAEPTTSVALREQLAAKRPSRELRDLSIDSDRAELSSYATSTNDLSKRLASDVQAGFQLGKAGAVYAARAKFVSVLRRIAMAKDAAEGGTRHASALAEGLRTLDDADDFVPRGDALEAELDVASISSSHGLRLVSAEGVVAPHEAIARYSQHAAKKLGEAAAAEPAGSMALYGLGKAYARLEAQGGDPVAGRKSLVMYRAAVATHGENYLAANELGVRLARDGRYEQASEVLRRAASQPTAIATVHANLAAIEAKLGRTQQAVVAETVSQQLAQQERAAGDVSRRHGVQWVDPEAFRRAGPSGAIGQQVPSQPVAMPVPAAAPAAYAQQPLPRGGYAPVTQATGQPQPTQQPGGWSGWFRTAKRSIGWSSPEPTAPNANSQPMQLVPQARVYR